MNKGQTHCAVTHYMSSFFFSGTTLRPKTFLVESVVFALEDLVSIPVYKHSFYTTRNDQLHHAFFILLAYASLFISQ